MAHKIFALAVIATVATSLSAHAQQRVIIEDQTTTGLAGVPVGGGIIADPQRPRFRQYIVEEQIPSYAIDQPVAVGSVLPEAGVVYYDVPQEFGATTYRYTVVNNRSILVDPRTRRVMQVIE
jgi:hypothetical protein